MIDKDLGGRIKKVREKLDLKQGIVVKKINTINEKRFTQKMLSEYENNKHTPGVFFFQKFSNLFNVNLNWLINGHGEMFLPEKTEERPKETGNHKKINERLKIARKLLNISQLEFGKKIGIGQSTVSDWENGTEIPLAYRIAIETELGISKEWLEGGNGQIFLSGNTVETAKKKDEKLIELLEYKVSSLEQEMIRLKGEREKWKNRYLEIQVELADYKNSDQQFNKGAQIK